MITKSPLPIRLLAFVPFAISGCSFREVSRTSSIDHSLREVVETGIIAGASVAISRGGEPLLISGYGVASLGGARVTSETLFNIGSVTKLFTAAAMLTLVDAGTVDLDDAVGSWLPALAAREAADVTIRQLLNHSSGLPEYGLADLARWQATEEPLTPGFVLSYLEGRALDYPPADHWAYTNTGFYLAGLVIEAASGQSWYRYLSSSVLQPLGLAVYLCDDVANRRARGYELIDGQLVSAPVYVEAGVRGDGGLCTTPAELTRFVEALEDGELLPAHLVHEMRTPTRLGSGVAVDYGLGVRLGALEGHRLWGHTGGHAGIVAVVARYPDDDLTIAVLSNTVRSNVDALVMEGDLAATLLGVSRAVPSTVAGSDLRPLAGRYVGARTEPTQRIDVEGDSLVVTRSDGVVRTLVPVGDNIFMRRPEPYPLDRYVFHVTDGRVLGWSAYYNGFHGAFFRRDDP